MSASTETVQGTITGINKVDRNDNRSFDFSVFVSLGEGKGRRALVAESTINGQDTASLLQVGGKYDLEVENRPVSDTSYILNQVIIRATFRQ